MSFDGLDSVGLQFRPVQIEPFDPGLIDVHRRVPRPQDFRNSIFWLGARRRSLLLLGLTDSHDSRSENEGQLRGIARGFGSVLAGAGDHLSNYRALTSHSAIVIYR